MLDELTTTSYFAVSTDSMLDVMLFMCIPGMLDELTTTSYFAVSTDSMLDVMLFMCIPGHVG